jgi:hypothetical protein
MEAGANKLAPGSKLAPRCTFCKLAPELMSIHRMLKLHRILKFLMKGVVVDILLFKYMYIYIYYKLHVWSAKEVRQIIALLFLCAVCTSTMWFVAFSVRIHI